MTLSNSKECSEKSWRLSAHPIRPLQKTHEFSSILPDEFPKIAEFNVIGVQAGVCLDAPSKIRASPWR
jgi:hypothetical protein